MTEEKKHRIRSFYEVDRKIVKVMRYISYGAAFCIVLIAVIAFANVIAAKVFKANYPSANDYITYLFVIVIYCSLPHMHMDRVLIFVDILTNHFSRAVNLIIGVFSDFLGIAVFGLMTWGSFAVFQEYKTLNELSSAGAVGAFKIWPFPLIMSVFCGIMGLSFIWNLCRRTVYCGQRKATPELLAEAGISAEQAAPPSPAVDDLIKEKEEV